MLFLYANITSCAVNSGRSAPVVPAVAHPLFLSSARSVIRNPSINVHPPTDHAAQWRSWPVTTGMLALCAPLLRPAPPAAPCRSRRQMCALCSCPVPTLSTVLLRPTLARQQIKKSSCAPGRSLPACQRLGFCFCVPIASAQSAVIAPGSLLPACMRLTATLCLWPPTACRAIAPHMRFICATSVSLLLNATLVYFVSPKTGLLSFWDP